MWIELFIMLIYLCMHFLFTLSEHLMPFLILKTHKIFELLLFRFLNIHVLVEGVLIFKVVTLLVNLLICFHYDFHSNLDFVYGFEGLSYVMAFVLSK